ncbi:MAG: DNA methylase, partial [Lachnospiraceae bacterium]|nr:DNA methylase [Lachnospiraceae bacterium]
MKHVYIAIDLKSFYASVECVERKLDPHTTNLVVADNSRTDKTICLAVSPGLKSYGISGRPRLFEVIQAVKDINTVRRMHAPRRTFTGQSVFVPELRADPALELDYITAVPRMRLYMQYSTRIYGIYLRYIAPEDIHVYSCDEVFIDATQYLTLYGHSAHDLAITMIRNVLDETGITATAGIGTNLFLSKVAMDIVAKRMPADKDGVRIADLNERSFREKLWAHTPITDFWRVGSGTARSLFNLGLITMGDVARYSEYGEQRLYKTFGINAELLIDHAWGWEPVTIGYIKN